jgi:hypothetical protein
MAQELNRMIDEVERELQEDRQEDNQEERPFPPENRIMTNPERYPFPNTGDEPDPTHE